MVKKYYIPFNLAADINYLYLFSLYDLAEYNTESRSREIVRYGSLSGLAAALSISRSTLGRVLNNPAYSSFFSWDKEKKEIRL